MFMGSNPTSRNIQTIELLKRLPGLRDFEVRPLIREDSTWLSRFVEVNWGSRKVVSRARVHYPEKLEGFVAIKDRNPVGLVTYRIENGECEVVTINSDISSLGIGSALLDAVKKVAASAGCRRLWLITTNDNLPALRFYQKRGFRLAALYPNALERSRELKPEIPFVGRDGIPLRDEIELEIPLIPPTEETSLG